MTRPRSGKREKWYLSLSVTSSNTAGVSESGLSCFISQLGDCIPWHVVCLQEAFKRLENLEIPGGHVVYTPSHRPQRGFRVPAVLVRADMGEDTEIYASGVRWVAVRVLSHAVLIISAHLPYARQSVMSCRKRSKRSRVALNVSSLLFRGTMLFWVLIATSV